MALVNLYDSVIKFPGQTEKSNTMAYLAYITRNAGSIIEYAGRTCYRSFNNIRKSCDCTYGIFPIKFALPIKIICHIV